MINKATNLEIFFPTDPVSPSDGVDKIRIKVLEILIQTQFLSHKETLRKYKWTIREVL